MSVEKRAKSDNDKRTAQMYEYQKRAEIHDTRVSYKQQHLEMEKQSKPVFIHHCD